MLVTHVKCDYIIGYEIKHILDKLLNVRIECKFYLV